MSGQFYWVHKPNRLPTRRDTVELRQKLNPNLGELFLFVVVGQVEHLGGAAFLTKGNFLGQEFTGPSSLVCHNRSTGKAELMEWANRLAEAKAGRVVATVPFCFLGIQGSVELKDGKPVWVLWGNASCQIEACLLKLRQAIDEAIEAAASAKAGA